MFQQPQRHSIENVFVDVNSIPVIFPVKHEVDQRESDEQDEPFNISKIVVFPRKRSSIFWVQEATVMTNNKKSSTRRPARKSGNRGASQVGEVIFVKPVLEDYKLIFGRGNNITLSTSNNFFIN
jgi:hypothetical protein